MFFINIKGSMPNVQFPNVQIFLKLYEKSHFIKSEYFWTNGNVHRFQKTKPNVQIVQKKNWTINKYYNII